MNNATKAIRSTIRPIVSVSRATAPVIKPSFMMGPESVAVGWIESLGREGCLTLAFECGKLS
jgi:hypothetical protein